MTSLFADSDFEQRTFNDMECCDDLILYKFFNDCSFVNCNFTNTKFDGCNFNNCRFENCNLSLVKIPGCYIHATCFTTCKLVGIDWTAATWKVSSKRRVPFTNQFRESILDYSLFVGLNLSGVEMVGCMAREVYFERANLQHGNFANTDFSGAIFTNCDLSGSDLSEARNYSINPTYNTLTKAKFSLPEAMSLIYTLDIELVD